MTIIAREKVGQALKEEIASGVAKPGMQLPSESALAARFGVGRGTVRRALAALQTEGFVRTEHGRGSFVQEAIYPYELSRGSRFSHTLDGLGVYEARETVRNGIVDANGRIGRLLGLQPTEKLALIEVVSFAQGLPLLVASNFVSAARFPGIGDAYERKQSLSAALRLYEMTTQHRTHTEIGSRLPSAEQARLLRQPRTSPITEVENMVVDQSGVPSWVEVLCFASNRVRLILER
ncbi:GntR family transcriptional regulator [Mesorhizobium sp. B4-1-4]|uniref:GntR family transcriptional regulator n=1 Tax=Mesorhizobium sp. B4-1-4 TaxID=2589888 RepID=UPI0015E42E64|nr:GntR family transcriptional regulator [Mesorhizobium sp. B4-1-4]UCI32023.1 GntR family transcriptional regulator [Mesorhizobium sp. B4-1-4]